MSAIRLAARATTPRQAALYPAAFAFDSDFGRCVGVDLSAALAANPALLAGLLHPAERLLCRGFRGARLVEFAGGRVAARLARANLPGRELPTLRGPGGRPAASEGVSVSISHTRRFAVALASDMPGLDVGVDIEPIDSGGSEALLAERILSAAERAGAPDSVPLLHRLSLKEAAYKALFPRHGHIPLREIAVLRAPGSTPGFRVTPSTRRALVEAASVDLHGHILSLARAN